MKTAFRRPFALVLSAAFLAESVGAADLLPALARGLPPPPPPASRFAPLPAPAPAKAPPAAAPRGERWLDSARVVARWARDEWRARTAPPEPAPWRTAGEASAAAPAETPAPPAPDRMLINMEGRRLLAVGPEAVASIAALARYRSELKPYRARWANAEVTGGPLRARVDYLQPLGLTRGVDGGYLVLLSNGYERFIPSRKPVGEAFRRDFPVYFAGDTVTVEVALTNDGAAPLTGLSVEAIQEDYAPAGLAGKPLSAPDRLAAPDLAPGETAIVRWTIRLSEAGTGPVNFEQTHLRVSGREGDAPAKLMLDAPQAGVLDPPGS